MAVASVTIRAELQVMLCGNRTRRRYRWAYDDEIQRMLTADALTADSCPPAPAGTHNDDYLIPQLHDYEYWLAWHDRRGCADQWIRSAWFLDPRVCGPEVTAYLGTHRPGWLWSEKTDIPFSVPLCVSYSTLRHVKQLHRGRVRWICDSRAFSEISQHGRWTITPEEYVRDVARFDEQIGGLQWAGPQDWPCEKGTIHGGKVGNVRAAGTGLSVREHQRRTVENYIILCELWPQYSDRACPFVPVYQGDTPDSYLRCHQMYRDAGVPLGEDIYFAGVGSVCRLQATAQLGAVARALGDLNMALHWFGLKLTGLRDSELLMDLTEIGTCQGTCSVDSMSWSADARYGNGKRLPDCTHRGRNGQLTRCNNCARYALWYYHTKVLPAITKAVTSPARLARQGELFPV